MGYRVSNGMMDKNIASFAHLTISANLKLNFAFRTSFISSLLIGPKFMQYKCKKTGSLGIKAHLLKKKLVP